MRWLPRTYLAMVYLLLYIPIAVLVVFSFNDSRTGYSWGGLSLRWYESLFNNYAMMKALGNSLFLALTAATVSTLIGALTALALHRYRFRGKKALKGMLFVVMMSPEIVLAISLLGLFLLAGIQLGYVSLLLAHVTFCLPFVVITVMARLSGFDERLPEAARDLGANDFTMTRTVLIPAIMPALMAGWLLGFTLSMDDVVVSTFVSGPSYEILPLRIYSMVRVGLKPEVNALGTLLLVFSLVMLLLSQWILMRNKQ
ncbi:spermidine/putrescine ABC transporter permease PotC [Marinobacter psychrophilus]|jgi:spermidine/putrescine transport system permease protein|uniref:spermidine/putrescine ABC transporter permease PotC n=1 Tax=Marinobacter psychrophilus TaxID=330734 RepID=UPI001B4A850F|nr:spermidine/putrescine ABC transporter permease PotC [Marinobacter psychrophilus]MBQ0761827.1 spermidine/putrescine ABC transporter permease PotC [Marinobacter psychrophilus]MBQ0846485.1 spermidine/putrescine ABC transporter permease PotC [Marinobacter psychrophilus]